jgi:prepilin-type N-terminal cleavage/methylation domain-containing protein
MSAPRRRGFTLIELLIVVVIIGVLAAIAIPKFNESRRKAQVAAMKGALRRAMTVAEAHFAANNTYVGVTFPSYAPVFVGSHNAGADMIMIEATHPAVAGATCRVYLGATDGWIIGDDGSFLREGVIGGTTCK